MTPLLFGAAGFILMGYLIGKLFKRLNPFLMLFGGFLMLAMYPAFLEVEYQNGALACFITGVVLNFNRPVSMAKLWLAELFGTFRLRKASAGYVSDIEEQKEKAEEELQHQKQQIEEELRRQKQQAEEDLARQKRAAEEDIRRQAENLRKEQERANQGWQRQSQNQSRQDSGQNSGQNQRKEHLNPRVFADACEVLGMSQGKTLAEYKKAYRKLMSMYHSDKLAGLSEELRKQEEEKAKLVNAAWETIRKKLK